MLSDSKEKILDRIKQIAIDSVELPSIDCFSSITNGLSPVNNFVQMVSSIGANCKQVKTIQEATQFLKEYVITKKNIYTSVPYFPFEATMITANMTPYQLSDADFIIISASVGVAENGAVWVYDKNLPIRVAPFISKDLAVILPTQAVVSTMHDAYTKINSIAYSFATFIAGPSRTADIAQELVVGVHGAERLILVLIDDMNDE